MSQISSSLLASFGCATCVVTTLVLIVAPPGLTGVMLAGAAFAGVFFCGIPIFSFARNGSVGAKAVAGAVTTLLAYPASILLLSLVAQAASSTGVMNLGGDRNPYPVFVDVWLFAMSFWILPALIVSLVVTVPVGTLAGSLVGFACQMDAFASRSPTASHELRLKNQLILALTLFILASALVAGRLASLPDRTGQSVIEKPAALDVIIHEDKFQE